MSKTESSTLTTDDSQLTTPERSCIVTREVKPKEALIRFVVGPEERLVPDLAGKLPGRGIYVTCSKLMVAEAMAKRLFSRAAKQQVAIPEGFMNQLETLMARRALEALSMARKAGQVITGFDAVEESCKKGEVEALIHASDAGEDGVKKLSFYSGPVFHEFGRDALSAIGGRENAVHMAVTHGPAAQFFITEARRFALFME